MTGPQGEGGGGWVAESAGHRNECSKREYRSFRMAAPLDDQARRARWRRRSAATESSARWHRRTGRVGVRSSPSGIWEHLRLSQQAGAEGVSPLLPGLGLNLDDRSLQKPHGEFRLSPSAMFRPAHFSLNPGMHDGCRAEMHNKRNLSVHAVAASGWAICNCDSCYGVYRRSARRW